MKKAILSTILSLSSLLVFTSCSTTQSSPETQPESGQITIEKPSPEKIQNIILNAGEKNGWIMTKFKNNALIAEKITPNNSFSTTITFGKSSFNLSPNNSELKTILTKALN